MKTTKRRRRPVTVGRVTWWGDTLSKDIAKQSPNRPPSTADGSTMFTLPSSLDETQVTESENHPGFLRHKRGHWSGDHGGEFLMQRTWVEGNFPQVMLQANQRTSTVPEIWVRRCRYGPILADNISGTSYPAFFKSSDSSLNAIGAELVAKCKPTNPAADMSTMLGEVLREGLPKLIGAALWKKKTKDARKIASDEFLNYQFGWQPIARDIGETAAAIWNAQTAIQQFQRDSGKLVRRRLELPTSYSSSVFTLTGSRPYLPVYSHSVFNQGTADGKVILHREKWTRRWFSGAFTYYLPSDGNVFGAMAEQALMAKKAIGLSLTPDVVWNLTPWSWAVDWFTNAGDVISNMSDWAYYSLCLRYGYVMEHTSARDTYTYVGSPGYKTSYLPPPIRLCSETKRRVRANPFGFGVTWNGLNPIQLAIAAALGIKRWG